MPTADRGDTKIVWEEQGSGPPLLLIMGHGWPRQMWQRHLPALTPNFRVILFDNRGVGETTTTATEWTIEDMAADAVAVLDAAEVERAAVYGASMGGGIAQEVALSYPDRVTALVLGCTAPKKAEAPKPLGNMVRYVLPALLKGKEARAVAAARAIAYGPTTPSQLIAEDVTLLASLNRPPSGDAAQQAAINRWAGSRERLGSIAVPTLILHGTHDALVPLHYGRELASLIPGAKLVVFEGAGHMYLTDATDAAGEAVVEFLTGPSAIG